jgi:hypothetical protein
MVLVLNKGTTEGDSEEWQNNRSSGKFLIRIMFEMVTAKRCIEPIIGDMADGAEESSSLA